VIGGKRIHGPPRPMRPPEVAIEAFANQEVAPAKTPAPPAVAAMVDPAIPAAPVLVTPKQTLERSF
jgi:hypothetical protein